MVQGREERLNAMLDHLVEVRSASAKSLAVRFGVSVMTVHRDLDLLAARGAVRKFHGGASVDRTANYEIAATVRRRLSVPQKQAIATAAAQTIRAGQTIIIDDSSTAELMVPAIAEFEALRVVTNALPVIVELAAQSRIGLQVLGGAYDHSHEALLGIGAVDAMRALRVDIAFVSTTSIDAEGLYHQEEQVVALKAEMFRSAKHRVLLMDESKFGQSSLHRICGWDQVDELITTTAAPAEMLQQIADQGVQVTQVEVLR